MSTVLVVDDESEIRHIIRLALARINVTVTEAQTAEQALTIAFASPPPDAIITDIHLPFMDGLQLVQKIHQTHANIPIIFVSAASEIMPIGVNPEKISILEKPFKLAKLQSLVQDVLAASVESTDRA